MIKANICQWHRERAIELMGKGEGLQGIQCKSQGRSNEEK